MANEKSIEVPESQFKEQVRDNAELKLLLSCAIKQFTELLIKSEERIDKTNEMVSKMTATVDGLRNLYSETEKEYIAQLNKVCKARDELLEQTRTQTSIIENMKRELACERERYHELLQRVLDTAKLSGNTFHM